MNGAAWFYSQSFNARQDPVPAAPSSARLETLTFDRWDAAKGRFKTFAADWNESTGIYDRNIREVT